MHAPGTPGYGRIMALDVGSKRIGVAVSDPLGITAQGLDTIQRQNKRRDLEALDKCWRNTKCGRLWSGCLCA